MQGAEEFVKGIWHSYLENGYSEDMFSSLDVQFSSIYPYAKKVSRNLEEYLLLFEKERKNWDGNFIICQEWYQTSALSEGTYLVVGEITIAKEKEDFSNIHVRFTAVCRLREKKWRLLHLHCSMPSKEIQERAYLKIQKELEKKNMELEEITQQAIYNARCDSMTGLLNRVSTEADIETCLKDGCKGVLFMIDVDNFKGINDTAGHLAGDRILIRLAEKLKRVFYHNSIIGRMGGDEFVVYLKDVSDAQEAIYKAQQLLSFAKSILIPKVGTGVTLSIGISFSPEDGKDFETLWNNADEALYHVKNQSKGSYIFHGALQEKMPIEKNNSLF